MAGFNPIGGERNSLAMVEEVMGQVIADVPKHATAEHLHSREPVVRKDCVGKFPEWSGQYEEKGGWHDESIAVHRKIVVDTVEEEVESQSDTVVREPPKNMSVSFPWGRVFDQGPTYLSTWKRKRCMRYSIKDQRNRPRTQ